MPLGEVALLCIVIAFAFHLLLSGKADDDEFEERWKRILESERSTNDR